MERLVRARTKGIPRSRGTVPRSRGTVSRSRSTVSRSRGRPVSLGCKRSQLLHRTSLSHDRAAASVDVLAVVAEPAPVGVHPHVATFFSVPVAVCAAHPRAVVPGVGHINAVVAVPAASYHSSVSQLQFVLHI